MPSKRIDKFDIINASIELLRSGVPLSARNIAKFLNCSTQPIYYLYKNMNNIESDLNLEVKKIYKNFVNNYLNNNGNITEYKAMGLAFVDFAKNEKGLFKHLYLDNATVSENNSFQNSLQEDILDALCKSCNLTKVQAENFQNNMAIYTFGLAMLQYFGGNVSDEYVSKALTQEFNALISLYKENK